MRLKNNIHFPFWNITFSVLIILTLSSLLQDGMFSDGVLYSCVSRNLALGIGSFWFPYFSEICPFFHQQPPLTFGIQSLFFKAFGDSLYVERFYSFVTLCISTHLIHRLWKTIHQEDEKIKSISWLPVLLWIIIPVCHWAYSNNVEENTMGIFTLLSTWYIYRGTRQKNAWLSNLIIGGFFAFIASLCKGFPGIFPIAIPFLYGLVFRSFTLKKMILYTLITTGTLLVTYGILLLNKNACTNLSAYLSDRVINSIENVSTENDRFYLIKQLGLELLSSIAFVILISFLLKIKSIPIKQTPEEKKRIIFFILIGLSASIPLIVTLEQRRFYLVTSLPYYAIAIALFISPALNQWIMTLQTSTKKFSLFRSASFLLLLSSSCYSCSFIGKTSRDQEKLHDVYLFGKIITSGKSVKVFPETWDDWGLHNYFVRHYNISLNSDNRECEYFLVDKLLNKTPSPAYIKLNEASLRYDLYRKNS